MRNINGNTTLSDDDLDKLNNILSQVSDEMLDKHMANVTGIGAGVKEVKGKPTGEPALIFLVTKKVRVNKLKERDIIPPLIQGFKTDVREVGHIRVTRVNEKEMLPALTDRIRPVIGGYSVGHINITAGTIATCVYDRLPKGIGIPRKYYILSNNHVLADENRARIGDPILQPGPLDGGRYPEDQVAVLSRFVPIVFYPPVPLHLQNNLVDAAIAEGHLRVLNREIYWIGYLKGWMKKEQVKPGMLVKKTGRTTGFTRGRIIAVNATVDVDYGEAGLARFREQIITTHMDEPGDSGSLVTTFGNVAVGLLFAGSEEATFLNQIENVLKLLDIEIAEKIIKKKCKNEPREHEK